MDTREEPWTWNGRQGALEPGVARPRATALPDALLVCSLRGLLGGVSVFTTTASYRGVACRRCRGNRSGGLCIGLSLFAGADLVVRLEGVRTLGFPVLPWEPRGHGNVARSLRLLRTQGGPAAHRARAALPWRPGPHLGSGTGRRSPLAPPYTSLCSFQEVLCHPQPPGRATALAGLTCPPWPLSTHRTWILFIRGPRLLGEGSASPTAEVRV